jgi:Bifunctional DNA primase/polymerase, N-terminal
VKSLSMMGREAIKLAERGFAVLALVPGGKLPLIPKWKGGRGVYDATTDPAKIATLWQTTPDANIAIACGDPSGIDVADIDPRNGGDVELYDLEEQFGRLPPTKLSETGGGGWHYLYRRHSRIRNRKLGMGIDIQSTGKYIVAPPSIHPSGKRYRWARDIEIAGLPDWFVDLVDPPIPTQVFSENSSKRDSQYVLDIIERGRRLCRSAHPAISGSGGHDTTFSIAVGLVRGLNLDVNTALELLVAEYNPRCQPPWSRLELAHKVAQAKDRSNKPFGFLLGGRAA